MFAGNVRTQSERLQALIDKLLRLAQLEQQRTIEVSTPVLISDLFDMLKPTFTTIASRRNIAIEWSTDARLVVEGDAFLLNLALANLLQNALDFSPDGGVVRCSAAEEAERVVIRVQDDGPGIADYARERLFERFFSPPRPDGQPKSTGLGLALVREVVGLHHGEIALDNAPTGGTVKVQGIAQIVDAFA